MGVCTPVDEAHRMLAPILEAADYSSTPLTCTEARMSEHALASWLARHRDTVMNATKV